MGNDHTTPDTVQVLDMNCTGPNKACRAAARRNRRVHVIPAIQGPEHPHLVMPTYHYDTVADGVKMIEAARLIAPTVETDADLETFRRLGVPHFLPVGWVDPSRR